MYGQWSNLQLYWEVKDFLHCLKNTYTTLYTQDVSKTAASEASYRIGVFGQNVGFLILDMGAH